MLKLSNILTLYFYFKVIAFSSKIRYNKNKQKNEWWVYIMQSRFGDGNRMRFYFSGETGKHFHTDDIMKNKIKKTIVKYLENYGREIEDYTFEFRVDDGFGLLALEAVLSFINSQPVNCRFVFRAVFEKDFLKLPINIQEYYQNIIMQLEGKGIKVSNKINENKVRTYHNGEDIKTMKINYHCYTTSGWTCTLVSYFEKDTGDKWASSEFNNYLLENKVIKINLYDVLNEPRGYARSSYVGVRRQKNSGKFYYRIKMKLPDCTPVNIEKGSFLTAEEASKAREQCLIELAYQECEDVGRRMEDVFNEFVETTCTEKPSLRKKYISYYNAHIKKLMGMREIGETLSEVHQLYRSLTPTGNTHNKTTTALTKNYVSGLRAMLCNFYDYAYLKKYINFHPMYAVPSKWGADSKEKHVHKKEKNTFTQPLFAYLGNKHRLLPDMKRLFPEDFDVFVDLFGGSSVVGINTNARQITINDNNLFLIGIYKGIQETTPDDAWRLLETIINRYSLNKENESGYYTCRDEYNKISYEERCNNYWYWGLVLVWCSFNRSTVQFNLQNEYNAPFGFNKVNFELAKQKFFAFAKKVSGSEIVFTCDDYKNVDIQTGAFVYIDPPYLITTATYNKGWDEQAESELYNYLETLDNKGVRWAMSNVFENNGENHTMLSDWVSRKKYRVHYLDGEYIHANFRRKNKGRTVEVLITNY